MGLAVQFMAIHPMAAITMERERPMPNLKLILTLDMPTLMDTHILMDILIYLGTLIPLAILTLLDIPIPSMVILMDTLMDMLVIMDMERGKLMPKLIQRLHLMLMQMLSRTQMQMRMRMPTMDIMVMDILL